MLMSQAPGSSSNDSQTLAELMDRLAGVTAALEEIHATPICSTQSPSLPPTPAPTTTPPMPTCYRGMSSSVSESYIIVDYPGVTTKVRCDTKTEDGGWVVIQRRAQGDVNFKQNWTSYRDGFGSPDGDFWLGNAIVHSLTSSADYELRVDVRFGDDNLWFAKFSKVKVDSEANKFRLTLGSYSGTVGDQGGSGFAYNNNTDFSTIDRDNDGYSNIDCAAQRNGGWWYKSCTATNLNGLWGVEQVGGMRWYNGNTHRYATFTEMKIRPTQ